MEWYWITLIAYFFIGIIGGLASYKDSSYGWDWEDFLFIALFWLPVLVMLCFCEIADRIKGGEKWEH